MGGHTDARSIFPTKRIDSHRMQAVFVSIFHPCRILLMALIPLSTAQAQDAASSGKEFFEQYCIKCHGEKKSKGKVTLHDFPYEVADESHLERWENVWDTLKSNEMPPDDEEQPTEEERKNILAWLEKGLQQQTEKHPAPVAAAAMARRLTNMEYQNTLRDLLGMDLKVIDDLPQDPIKPYHFHNTAEFMLIGQEQIDRYLEIARRALGSAIVDAEAPKVVKKRAEWNANVGHQNGLSNNAVGLWGNHRQSAAMGLSIADPPTTGEFRLRF